MCFLDYEEYRCFCSKHAEAAFKSTTSSLHSRSLKKDNKEDLCCLCMDKIEPKISMHSVVKTDCCGPRFYHFDCMQVCICIYFYTFTSTRIHSFSKNDLYLSLV
ncbi:hypothetical protein TELCIR_14927 [Teladorsagia circumcincta]|uniref:Uncharacterized protein n=1 Tax=Teladorsagia circumcincta TaxID=45464 RepID=A0A2G9TZR4_TELCI|nr:hypothetical protein TELCIR_14927 [Teladorsagia circumcincta]